MKALESERYECKAGPSHGTHSTRQAKPGNQGMSWFRQLRSCIGLFRDRK